MVRRTFFSATCGTLCQISSDPPFAASRSVACGCDLGTHPPLSPLEGASQEIRIAWDDCVIRVDEGIPDVFQSMLWVIFRKAGDAPAWVSRRFDGDTVYEDDDHAYAIFDGPGARRGFALEVASEGFGWVGCLLVRLFVGPSVDRDAVSDGMVVRGADGTTSRIDLSQVTTDQAWVYDRTAGMVAPSVLSSVEESARIANAIRAADEVREATMLYVERGGRYASMALPEVREAILGDHVLLSSSTRLRAALVPFALHVEDTEVFRIASELHRVSRQVADDKRRRRS